MFNGIDLFSDTASLPSEPMKRAMFEAPLGDEQKGEDPTTHRLEERLAAELGKEAAIFFPSATMANEVALCALGSPGDELITAEDSHLLAAETGGPAVHARLLVRPIRTVTGVFAGSDVKRAFRHNRGPLFPVSRIVSVENTTNFGGGVAWPIEAIRDVTSTARELGLSLHLDGSRLFNAAVSTEVPAWEIAEAFDTVTICLSKGLGCPAGALLAFSRDRWDSIRRLKQQMGGSLRQSGILAAAGLYALEHNVERLADDHANARRLADGLREMAGVEVENPEPSTNMVFFRWVASHQSGSEFLQRCEEAGVRFSAIGTDRFRAVTHLSISELDIDNAIAIVRRISAE